MLGKVLLVPLFVTLLHVTGSSHASAACMDAFPAPATVAPTDVHITSRLSGRSFPVHLYSRFAHASSAQIVDILRAEGYVVAFLKLNSPSHYTDAQLAQFPTEKEAAAHSKLPIQTYRALQEEAGYDNLPDRRTYGISYPPYQLFSAIKRPLHRQPLIFLDIALAGRQILLHEYLHQLFYAHDAKSYVATDSGPSFFLDAETEHLRHILRSLGKMQRNTYAERVTYVETGFLGHYLDANRHYQSLLFELEVGEIQYRMANTMMEQNPGLIFGHLVQNMELLRDQIKKIQPLKKFWEHPKATLTEGPLAHLARLSQEMNDKLHELEVFIRQNQPRLP